jgi:glycosyltransferase
MKVSVITVCFNSAKTVADTLQSVASQTHADIEHLVIDGGSGDQTLNIVREQGHHVARVVSEPDFGIYDAMNKGIALATGDLVGFLNADDVFASPASVNRIATVAQTTEADAIYGDLVYVRADDTRAIVRRWRSGEFRRSRLSFGWMPPHPTFYVRRTLLQQVGGFDTRLRIAADYDLILRCLTQPRCRVAYVPEVLVRMRMGGASNRSIEAMWRKSREDLGAMHRTGVGGIGTLLCKNLRKLPQFLR